MDPTLSAHLARVHHLRESFVEANERLVALLREATDDDAERVVDGSWSAAQVAWHVSKATSRFAGLISGDLGSAQPLGADFRERDWSTVGAQIPPKLKTSDALEPPPGVRREDAIAALEAAGVRLARAYDALTPERGASFGISHPLVGGPISLYQVGEWASAHVRRHYPQALRALDRT